jgi:hypothetical protein
MNSDINVEDDVARHSQEKWWTVDGIFSTLGDDPLRC